MVFEKELFKPTLTKPWAEAPPSAGRGGVRHGPDFQVRVVVEQVEVRARLHTALGLLPNGRTLAVSMETRQGPLNPVPFLVTGVTPTGRQPSALKRAWEERGAAVFGLVRALWLRTRIQQEGTGVLPLGNFPLRRRAFLSSI